MGGQERHARRAARVGDNNHNILEVAAHSHRRPGPWHTHYERTLVHDTHLFCWALTSGPIAEEEGACADSYAEETARNKAGSKRVAVDEDRVAGDWLCKAAHTDTDSPSVSLFHVPYPLVLYHKFTALLYPLVSLRCLSPCLRPIVVTYIEEAAETTAVDTHHQAAALCTA